MIEGFVRRIWGERSQPTQIEWVETFEIPHLVFIKDTWVETAAEEKPLPINVSITGKRIDVTVECPYECGHKASGVTISGLSEVPSALTDAFRVGANAMSPHMRRAHGLSEVTTNHLGSKIEKLAHRVTARISHPSNTSTK